MKSSNRQSFVLSHHAVFLFLGSIALMTGQLLSAAAQAPSQTLPSAHSALSQFAPNSQTLQGPAAIEQLKQSGQYDSLQAAMQHARYSVDRVASSPFGPAAWRAPNPAGGYDGYVTEDGVSIAIGAVSQVSLTLRGIGYGDLLQDVGAGKASGDQHTIRIERDGPHRGLKEWYVNTEQGLEQGFTLSEPPLGQRSGLKLRLALEIGSGWRAIAHADGQRVTLLGDGDGEAVDYKKLVIWDANGSPVPGALLVEDGRVIIEVDDANSTYPLTIDPTFALQQKITAADGLAGDQFGSSLAINGETAVIGVPMDDTPYVDQGSAFVFVRQGATWVQQAKLTASDGDSDENFGISVAISGDTIVVGAWRDGVFFLEQGSAYVFVRSGITWSQQGTKLIVPDGMEADRFGFDVAVSGNTVVVGAYLDDVGANVNQGSAYVFVRSGVTWSLQQQLTAGVDGSLNDRFGVSVAISGETIVVGASRDDVGANGDQGSVYVFVRTGVTWSQQGPNLTSTVGTQSDEFGISVAISGDTLVVGAFGVASGQGAAYVFARSGTNWLPQGAELLASDGLAGDRFGISVALNGDTLVVGAYLDDVDTNADQGSAYIFTRSSLNWTQQRKLSVADYVAGDRFGSGVAVSGETVLVGASFDDIGASADQGSVSVFTNAGTELKITASDGIAGDLFGVSVALDGDTAVVGAYQANVAATVNQGVAYVFVRNGSSWTQQGPRLIAPDGLDNDEFGFSVAISGDTLVVGARLDDVFITNFLYPDFGSAYVFTRNNGMWTLQQQLFAGETCCDVQQNFGASVAISGETIVVGVPRYVEQFNGNRLTGAAYVFVRSGVTWTQQAQLLLGEAGSDNDLFGISVAISGDTAVVGAYGDDVGENVDQGSAHVFTRSTGTWLRQAQLNGVGGAAGDFFGVSVGVSGDTVVVGAFLDDLVVLGDDRGSAYVFVRSGTTWAEQQRLTAQDGAAADRFGVGVAISGEKIVVGANNDDVSFVDQGSAYVFARNATSWSQQAKLTALDGLADDQFGVSAAISGDTIIIGAYLDDVTFADRGSAYVYEPCRYDLSPFSTSIGVSGGSASFAVNASSRCAWTASALPDWLTITSSASGTGNGNITFTAAPNAGLPRTSSIGVSGSSFVVSQDGSCTLTVNPAGLPGGVVSSAYNQSLTTSGGIASYWQLVNSTTLPQGLSMSGFGVITGTPGLGTQGNYPFTVAATASNGCIAARSYTLNIASCAVSALTPSSQNVPGVGGNFNFIVTAPGCAWTTISSAPWLAITQNPSGTGNLQVGFTVVGNTGAARSAIFSVNDQVFTVNQALGDPSFDVVFKNSFE